MLELLLELLTNRLGIFLLGVALIVGSVYGWKEFRHEVRLYDAAVGKEGITTGAKIVWKNTERSKSDSYRDDGGSTLVGYINVEFDTDNGNQRTKVYLDSGEYNSVKEGDIIQIHYHPNNPEYIVTPQMKRPTVLLSTIAVTVCFTLGVLLCLAVIISLF